MHGHTRVAANGVDGHLGLDVGGLGIREVVAVGRLISLDGGHGDGRWRRDVCRGRGEGRSEDDVLQEGRGGRRGWRTMRICV